MISISDLCNGRVSREIWEQVILLLFNAKWKQWRDKTVLNGCQGLSCTTGLPTYFGVARNCKFRTTVRKRFKHLLHFRWRRKRKSTAVILCLEHKMWHVLYTILLTIMTNDNMKGKSLEGNALFPDRPDSLFLILLPFLLFRYDYYFFSLPPFLLLQRQHSVLASLYTFIMTVICHSQLLNSSARGKFNHLSNFEFSFLLDRYQK